MLYNGNRLALHTCMYHHLKVTVQEDGCRHRFGMIAVNKLEEGECIFKIPRSILLEPKTSSISKIIEELNSQAAETTERYSGRQARMHACTVSMQLYIFEC